MDELVRKQMKEFSAFLNDEYTKFIFRRRTSGNGVPSQTDFAKDLGVTQASFSNWVNEVRPPNRENLDILATKLGPKVYDIFGIPRHMPNDRRAKKIMERWSRLSESQQKQLEEMTANFLDENEQAKGDFDRNAYGTPA